MMMATTAATCVLGGARRLLAQPLVRQTGATIVAEDGVAAAPDDTGAPHRDELLRRYRAGAFPEARAVPPSMLPPVSGLSWYDLE